MSEHQWPILPPHDSEVQHSTEQGADADELGRFSVFIEELDSSNRPLIRRGSGHVWPTRAEARQEAAHLARNFVPRHPLQPQNRGSFQLSEDEFLTIVDGATRQFHFRVLVVKEF